MSFFWPPVTIQEPSVVGRIGRVLHWSALAISGLSVAMGTGMLFFSTDPGDRIGGFVVGIGVSVLSALVGRGLRYVLSAE
jgi:cytochrome b561